MPDHIVYDNDYDHNENDAEIHVNVPSAVG
jgi:hypothetical protein